MKNIFKLIITLLIALSLSACERKETVVKPVALQQNSDGLKKSIAEKSGPKQEATQSKKHATIKVGIILPLEHQALNEIVAGFSEQLPKMYGEPVQIKIMNAQGDQNLQRAIIQQMHDQNYDLIVPVSTGVTQMTVAMIRNKSIVSLAADISEADRQQLKPCNIVTVHDEISPRKLMEFLHTAYPKLKKLSLIHSTADKIFPDVKTTIAVGKQLGIEVKPIMVATLPELVSATQALPAETQAIFILKDNLLASGAPTLIKAAADRHIPLFTSDQGTVKGGAGFALGVREKQIGEEGAKLAAAIIAGDTACHIANVEMKKLTVFINKTSLQKEQQDVNSIEVAAKKMNYQIEFVGEE